LYILYYQYESFILPLIIILSLVVGICGAYLFLFLFGLENNIYAQVAMVMLIGLLGKNAVLIVEFAAKKHSEGETTFNSALEGAKVRFRPILMTSFAFIAGLLPLVFATGGAIGNRTIGSASAGGMLIGTVFGLFVIPGLYYIFATIAEKYKFVKEEEENPLTEDFTNE
jgi:HAE1 family hydrophobic/amphiphilic exporter-1